MHRRHVAVAALVGASLVARPATLSAQAEGAGWAQVSVGVALKPVYGVSDTRGPMLSVGAGRFLLPRLALRLNAEAQLFDAGAPTPVYTTPPCPYPGCLFPMDATPGEPGAGQIAVASALASAELYEQTDRRGFYLVAGLGPQVLVHHPDRSPAIRLAAQAGAGISFGGAVLVEARYQATLGARAEPRHVVVLSLGVRHARSSRAPG